MAGNSNFKTLYLWVDRDISKHFSLLISLWWVLSEPIIMYPKILKPNLAGLLWRHFPAKKSQNLKNKKNTILGNGEFYIVANFQVNFSGERFRCHTCPPWNNLVLHHLDIKILKLNHWIKSSRKHTAIIEIYDPLKCGQISLTLKQSLHVWFNCVSLYKGTIN